MLTLCRAALRCVVAAVLILAGAPVRAAAAADCGDAAMCSYYRHDTCPTLEILGSPGLKSYPFLVERLVTALEGTLGDFDCTPSSKDDVTDPAANEETDTHAIVTERPGLVCLRSETDVMYRGAGHPGHDEVFTCFDVAAEREIGFAEAFPALAQQSEAWQDIASRIDGHLVTTCCGDDATDETTFEALQLDAPSPSGWAIDEDGNLLLGFQYSTYGRAWMASATVPRDEIVDAVAAPYRPAFTPSR